MCHPRKEGTSTCWGHCEDLLCTERVSSRTDRDQRLVSIFRTTLHTHVLQNRSEERASVSMGRTWGMNVLYGHCFKIFKFMIKTFRWRHQSQFFGRKSKVNFLNSTDYSLLRRFHYPNNKWTNLTQPLDVEQRVTSLWLHTVFAVF